MPAPLTDAGLILKSEDLFTVDNKIKHFPHFVLNKQVYASPVTEELGKSGSCI